MLVVVWYLRVPVGVESVLVGGRDMCPLSLMRLVLIWDWGAERFSLGLEGAEPTKPRSGTTSRLYSALGNVSSISGDSSPGDRATTGTCEKCSVGMRIWKINHQVTITVQPNWVAELLVAYSSKIISPQVLPIIIHFQWLKQIIFITFHFE